jgi:hypothetical protein
MSCCAFVLLQECLEAIKWARPEQRYEVQDAEEEAVVCAAYRQHKATERAATTGEPAEEVILISGALQVINNPVRLEGGGACTCMHSSYSHKAWCRLHLQPARDEG